MSSREQILNRVRANKPPQVALPDVSFFEKPSKGAADKFRAVLSAIGGSVYYVHSYAEVAAVVKGLCSGNSDIIYSPITQVQQASEQPPVNVMVGRDLKDVEWAVIKGHFGIAENGAIWVTNDLMEHRVLPFICQRLAIVIGEEDILPTMHEAYPRINCMRYQYGAFIAGPSKTADIEQSLVLGAHGPKGMAVFIMLNNKGY